MIFDTFKSMRLLTVYDKEELKDAFDILKMILLEEDLEYAEKVLKETMKHDSASPYAIGVTYKRLKEDLFIYEDRMDLVYDLPSYDIDTSQYDNLIEGLKI